MCECVRVCADHRGSLEGPPPSASSSPPPSLSLPSHQDTPKDHPFITSPASAVGPVVSWLAREGGGGGCRDKRARAAGARGRGARLATEGARSTSEDEAREDSETASARQMPRVQRGFCRFPRGRARCHSPLRRDLIRPLDRRALSTQPSAPLQILILIRHSDSSGMASPTEGLCGIGRSCSSRFSFSD